MNETKRRSTGFWMLLGFGALLIVIYILGQTMAIINYDFAVSIGLQEPVHEITDVGVALNKGFGLGDTVFYIPLFIIGIIGMLKRSAIGLYAMFGALAITIYWPIVGLATVFFAKGAPGWYFTDYASYSVILSLIILYGIWGIWFLFKNRNILVMK